MAFLAATYNVLATAYIRADRYEGVPEELLRPGWRVPALVRHVGYRQVVELLEACERFPLTCRGWLVCGDFNATEDSDVVAAMREAGFEHAHAGQSAARSCVADGRARLIDYLFHSAGLRSNPL